MTENPLDSSGTNPQPQAPPTAAAAPRPIASKDRIPKDKQERFNEVAALLEDFGRTHLDPELTGFTLELWRRLCRKQTIDCRRGQPQTWAAAAVHVIARMNFLFDRQQPVHLTSDVITGWFQSSKNTISSKATEIERLLRLRQHAEPGLCRGEFVEGFTMVQLSNGMVLTLQMAKQMGYVPPDVTLG